MGGRTDSAYMKEWRRRNPEADRANKKRYRDKIRRDALVAYSQDPPSGHGGDAHG